MVSIKEWKNMYQSQQHTHKWHPPLKDMIPYWLKQGRKLTSPEIAIMGNVAPSYARETCLRLVQEGKINRIKNPKKYSYLYVRKN